MIWICVYFSHLAGSAALDVFGDKGFHVWPPVIGCYELERFGNSRVTGCDLVVKKGCYSPPKFVVFHNGHSGAAVPVGSV